MSMKLKLLTYIILISSSALMAKAYAICTPIAGFSPTRVNMFVGRVVVRPSHLVGEKLEQRAFRFNRNESSTYICNNQSSAPLVGVLLQNRGLSSLGNNIYNTNIPGIGIRLFRTNLHAEKTAVYPYRQIQALTGTKQRVLLADSLFNIEIYKTAPITGSGEIVPGVYTHHYLGNVNSNRPSLITSIAANAITIASSSCMLQGSLNRTLTLPRVKTTDFKGIGSTAGELPFKLDLLCNGGANPTEVKETNTIGISFNFDSSPDLLSIKNSEPTTTAAKGVNTQMVYNYNGANTIVEKDKDYKLGIVSSNTSNITFSINMRARYIQTEANITPGKVKGIASVNITYN